MSRIKKPVTRTLDYLRSMGWIADRVDRQAGRASFDFLGVADVIALHPDSESVLAIQCTDNTNVSARVKKLEGEDLAASMAALRKCNIAIEVWGWYRDKPKPRVVDLS